MYLQNQVSPSAAIEGKTHKIVDPAFRESTLTMPGEGYVHALDGIRFLAVFMVLLKHTGFGASSHFAPIHMVGTLAKEGTGVPLFFVVSGFLITRILDGNRSGVQRYRNFVARRSLRIFPLYYAYVILCAIVAFAAGHSLTHAWVYLLYLQNVFPALSSDNHGVLPMYHLWTLSAQEQFYLVWPLLVWACPDFRKVRRLCWTVVFLSFLVRLLVNRYLPLAYSEQLMPCRAGEMALGGLFAMECYGRTWISSLGPKLLWFFLALSCGVALMHFGETPFGLMMLHEFIALFATSLLAAALDARTLTAKVLGVRWLAEIGRKYSYGLFIFHPMVGSLIQRLGHLEVGSVADGFLRVAFTVVCSVFLAKLSYTYFERHALHLKRFFPSERHLPRPVTGMRDMGKPETGLKPMTLPAASH